MSLFTKLNICSICMKKMKDEDKKYLNCGDAFCSKCITNHSKSGNKTCPSCQEQYDEISDHKPGEEHCVICMDTMSMCKGYLGCGHSFCHDCISDWGSSSRKCPICKTNFTTISKLKTNYPPIQNSYRSAPSPRPQSPTLLIEIPLEIGMVPSKRMFGHFKCVCGKWWKSGYAYDGIKQDCQRCKRGVLPYQLDPLRDDAFGRPHVKAPHQCDLCGMCRKLGRDCSTMPSYTQHSEVDDLVSNFMSNLKL